MTRVLKSNFEINEVFFPPLPLLDEQGHERRDEMGNVVARLPSVTLPKAVYTRDERARGKVPYFVLSDEQQARLAADTTFKRMLAIGSFELLGADVHSIPIEALEPEVQRRIKITALEQEGALLRSFIRKHDLEVPTFDGAPAPAADVPASAEALAKTDVSLPDPFGVAVSPVPPRPAVRGQHHVITLPDASITPGLLPDFAGEPPLRAGETRPLRAQGRK